MRHRFNAFVLRHEIAWELSMGVLALAFVGVGFASMNAPAGSWAITAEWVLTGIFVAEFGSRFLAATSRSAYLRGHWLDLVALLPSVRGFRLLRLLRLLRLVRAFASLHRALVRVEELLGNRQVATIGIIWLAVLILTSFGLYVAEHGVNDAVRSPLDAMWWGVVTMTTVGYGDVYPITVGGRLAATVLMIMGIALFSVITATVTGLIARRAEEDEAAGGIPATISALHALPQSGAITGDEYEAKKADLLARL